MVLVFSIALVLVTIIAILLILAFMLCISKLEIDIKNMHINNQNKRENNKKIEIKISLKIGKWHWLKIKLDKEKIANLYAKTKIQEYSNSIKYNKMKERLETSAKKVLKDKEIRKLIRNTNMKVEKFNANIAVGTESYIFTSYIVAIISIVISNILPHVIKDDDFKKNNISQIVHYRIVPIYRENNEYNIYLTMCASTNVLHLIKIFIRLIKINKKEKRQNNKVRQLLENKNGIKVKIV